MNMYICSSCCQAFLAAFALLFICVGCFAPQPVVIPGTPPPFSCARFTEPHWEELIFGVDSPDDVAATVARLWNIDKEQVRVPPTEMAEANLTVKWAGDVNARMGETYSALFRRDRQLTHVEVRWGVSRTPPTLAQVVDCLGFPQYYESVYTAGAGEAAFRQTLGLWYTEKGLVVNHTSFHNRVQVPAVHPNQMMDSFIAVAPGPPEQMVRDVYSLGDRPSVYTYGLCVLRPWPGSIGTIEVEVLLKSLLEEDPRCDIVPAALS